MWSVGFILIFKTLFVFKIALKNYHIGTYCYVFILLKPLKIWVRRLQVKLKINFCLVLFQFFVVHTTPSVTFNDLFLIVIIFYTSSAYIITMVQHIFIKRSLNDNSSLHIKRVFTQDWPNFFWITVACYVLLSEHCFHIKRSLNYNSYPIKRYSYREALV